MVDKVGRWRDSSAVTGLGDFKEERMVGCWKSLSSQVDA